MSASVSTEASALGSEADAALDVGSVPGVGSVAVEKRRRPALGRRCRHCIGPIGRMLSVQDQAMVFVFTALLLRRKYLLWRCELSE